MNIHDFETPEEKINFLTKTEEGRLMLKQIQDMISDVAFMVLDTNDTFKGAITELKQQGFEINVGVSVAVGVDPTIKKDEFNKTDKEFLDSLKVSWEGTDEEKEVQT